MYRGAGAEVRVGAARMILDSICSTTCTMTSLEKWSDDLSRRDRLRFTINVLTRLRVCTADGRVDLKWKANRLAGQLRRIKP